MSGVAIACMAHMQHNKVLLNKCNPSSVILLDLCICLTLFTGIGTCKVIWQKKGEVRKHFLHREPFSSQNIFGAMNNANVTFQQSSRKRRYR